MVCVHKYVVICEKCEKVSMKNIHHRNPHMADIGKYSDVFKYKIQNTFISNAFAKYKILF